MTPLPPEYRTTKGQFAKGAQRSSLFDKIIQHLRLGNGCWEWAGVIDSGGYGRVSHLNQQIGAHRAVYEMVNGSIPDGLEIDHLCHNPPCVRPDHLEAVTHAENIRRSAIYKQQTHCTKGHPLCGDNLAPATKGRFRCRICKNERGNLDMKNKAAAGKCKCGRIPEPGYKCCSLCRQTALDRHYRKEKP